MSEIFACLLFTVMYVFVHIEGTGISTNYIKLFDLSSNHSNYLDKLFSQNKNVDFHKYLADEPSLQQVMNVTVLQKSDIFYFCDKKIPNLSDPDDLDHARKFPDILLCMGLSHILLLNGLLAKNSNSSNTLPFLKTKEELKSLIESANSNSTFKNNICSQHKVTLPAYETDVVEYVKLVNPLLNQTDFCQRMCVTYFGRINPVCAVITEANSLFYKFLKDLPPLATNSLSPSIKIDSVQAMEQESGKNDKTIPNTKEITDDHKIDVGLPEIPINRGNIAQAMSDTLFNASAPVINETNIENADSNAAKSLKSANVEKIVVPEQKPSTSSTIAVFQKTVAPSPVEDMNVNEGSNENTDDDDYKMPVDAKIPNKVVDDNTKIKSEKKSTKVETTSTKLQETSAKVEPKNTKLQAQPTGTNETSSNKPNKLVMEDGEDNAKEAENEPDVPSLLSGNAPTQITEKKSNKEAPKKTLNTDVSSTSMRNTDTVKKAMVEKTAENENIEGDFDNPYNPTDEEQPDLELAPAKPPMTGNMDTFEAGNINIDKPLLGNNEEEEATFNSNVDNQPFNKPEDNDIQENTPYIIQQDRFVEAEDSHFFTYFVMMSVICIIMYLAFYNKRKLLALALEGRHGGRRTRSRRNTSYSRVNTSYDDAKEEHLLY